MPKKKNYTADRERAQSYKIDVGDGQFHAQVKDFYRSRGMFVSWAVTRLLTWNMARIEAEEKRRAHLRSWDVQPKGKIGLALPDEEEEL